MVEVLDEGDGAAGDEGKLDVRPVGIGLVFHQGPTLELGFGFGVGWENEAVGGFPDGGFDDVADGDVAIALASEVDDDRFFVLVARLGQSGEGLGEFGLKFGVFEVDGADLVEVDGLDGVLGEEVEDGKLDDFFVVILGGAGFHFDAQNGSCHLFFCAEVEGNFGAAELVEEIVEGRVFGEVDLERGESFVDGVLGRIRDVGDGAMIEVLEDEGFEDVVDLVGFEAKFGGGVVVNDAGVLEVADAGGVEDDELDGNGGGLGGGRERGGIGERGKRDGGDGEGEDESREFSVHEAPGW